MKLALQTSILIRHTRNDELQNFSMTSNIASSFLFRDTIDLDSYTCLSGRHTLSWMHFRLETVDPESRLMELLIVIAILKNKRIMENNKKARQYQILNKKSAGYNLKARALIAS